MASIIQRLNMAIRTGIAAFRDPEGDRLGSADAIQRRAYINLLWAYYRNAAFDSVSNWQQYRKTYQLYRNIRSIYNPTKRVVNFYVAQVYPGVLSDDASRLPDGVQLAIPLSEDTPDDLKVAIAQFWQWSNWQLNNKLMVRFGGATGSCLVEVVDDRMKGKVSAAVQWPGLIADKAKDGSPSLVLDDVGNVKFYALEYDAEDGKGNTFKYRQEVSQEVFRYYRNDSLETEVGNPYGFVPAVWCKHIDEGSDFGVPAIAGSLTKIDELNGLVSHTHDQIDILIDSPGVIGSTGSIGTISADAAARKSTADEYAATQSVQEKPTRRLLLKGPADTKWVPLTGNLQPEQVIPHMEKLLSELEHDFPELSMYTELRKMSQITGPGAARMMGDVGSRVLEVSSNYDTQSIKLFQMATAIGGFRYAEGRDGWRDKTEQRKKFAPFGLDSYQRGELDFSIMPRPLIPMTEADSIELTGKRLDNAKKAGDIFSEDRCLELAGISDPGDRAKEKTALETERKAAAELIPPPPKVVVGSAFPSR